MEIHSWTCFSPHFKWNGNESLDMFQHVSVHILNKTEMNPWTCFSPHLKQNGNTSWDMFRHVYSNADIQMATSASLDMFGYVYSNTNIQMPTIFKQKMWYTINVF